MKKEKSIIDMEYEVVNKILKLKTKIDSYLSAMDKMNAIKHIDLNNYEATGDKDPIFIKKRYEKALKNLQEYLETITKDNRVQIIQDFTIRKERDWSKADIIFNDRDEPIEPYIEIKEPITHIVFNGDYFRSTKTINGDLDFKALTL